MNVEELHKIEELKEWANEFIEGTKNKKDNKDEFYKLLNDLEQALDSVPEGSSLYDLYDRLTK